MDLFVCPGPRIVHRQHTRCIGPRLRSPWKCYPTAMPYLLALAALLVALGSWACGDDSTGGGSGGASEGGAGTPGSSGNSGYGASGGDATSDCRFERPACVSCIASGCAAEAEACYGADWTPSNLCNGTASASCQAASASESLDKQLAYAQCVASRCTSSCSQ